MSAKSSLVLSGDSITQIAQTMKNGSAGERYKVCDRFRVDAQAVADKMDGVVLFIQPWVTKRRCFASWKSAILTGCP